MGGLTRRFAANGRHQERDNRRLLAEIIFELSPDAYFVTENKRIADCNPAFERMMGVPREKLIGVQPSTLSPERQPDGRLSAEAIKDFSSQFALNKPIRFEWTHQNLDGAPLPVLATVIIAERNGKPCTICFWQDMREVVRLREAEQRRQREAAAAAAAQRGVVEQLAERLKRLAGCDLSAALHTAFPSEYEALRRDFNAALETLGETMRHIAQNAEAVRAEAAGVTSASDNIARRTEHQAATLEQTAAAVAELTEAVARSAERAKSAQSAVRAAKAETDISANVLRETLSAMGELEISSRQIGTILSVINDIAFQTNLLALNAGVEAARAGDAGRGFAVVATEVRALAQRSADAAKEIKTLIGASTRQVDVGVKLVGQTGEALTRIVTQVNELAGLVGDIAGTAGEQATGLREVNTAVKQMDQVTQQNAAMVEEATAACHNLAREADDLARLVARFELGEGAGPAPVPQVPLRTMAMT
jgi:methyl-accepting chemotaxis protein